MSGKILALDYGKKRIGVAITDPDQTVAFPRETWKGKTNIQVLETLKNLIKEEKVCEIVVGFPLALSGEKTAQTRETEVFIETLSHLGIPIHTMDERWTTIQADLTGGDDAVAAQILLKTYLDKCAKILP